MDNDDNVINLLEYLNKRVPAVIDDNDQYEETDANWENAVDLSLQEFQEYIEKLFEHDKILATEIYDIRRDIADLKRALQIMLRGMQNRGGYDSEKE